MEKKGKFDLLTVLIASIVIFVVYAVFVFGGLSTIKQNFPVNGTNASATSGQADASLPSMDGFNSTSLTLFQCNISTNFSGAQADIAFNLSNVSLFIAKVASNATRERANKNATVNGTDYGESPDVFNSTETGVLLINFTNLTTKNEFDEGQYFWFCEAMLNSSGVTDAAEASFQHNFTSVNRTFIIDKSPPFFNTTTSNYTNVTIHRNGTTDRGIASTSGNVSMAVYFYDNLTSIHTVRLFVNISGKKDNQVDITRNGLNNSVVNLSFRIPANQTDQVLNFTMWVNDSVNNFDITPALIFTVEEDGTPPSINLSNPITVFNTSNTTVLLNFSAVDNNDTSLTCGINISSHGTKFVSIEGLNVTSGVHHLNYSNATGISLSNGTYHWSVNCTDSSGNSNTSNQVFNFTVDQIPPVYTGFNISNGSLDAILPIGNLTSPGGPASGAGSWAQGREFFVIGNVSDNLTRPFEGEFQFYNTTPATPVWTTIATTVNVVSHNITRSATKVNSTINFSFTVPQGRNEFEGKNVSFRFIVNDTLGNINTSATIPNITININDTTVPAMSITQVNGTNYSSNRDIFINWSILDNSGLANINWSINSVIVAQPNCNDFGQFETQAGAERARNYNVTLFPSSEACTTLGNGTHYLKISTRDTWGNVEIFNYTFSIQFGSVPGLRFTLRNEEAAGGGVWSKSAINNTNITSRVGINLSGTTGVNDIAGIDRVSYFSSCDSTVRVEKNGTVVYPFNASSCNIQSENRTLTVTVNDTAGNSNTTVLGFLVDNVGPSLIVNTPTDGQNFERVQTRINVSFLDDDQDVASIVYYDFSNGVEGAFYKVNLSARIASRGENTTSVNSTNFTAGTRKIKIRVNDSVGNAVNSSVITFVQIGPISILAANSTITLNNPNNVSNLSFFNGSSIHILTDSAPVDQTFELRLVMNRSRTGGANVTINFNGSAADWNKTDRIVIELNDSITSRHLANNYTTTVIETVRINSSGEFSKFLSNNDSYFVKIRMRLDVNGTAPAALGKNGTQLLYFTDDANLRIAPSTSNVTQCSFDFSPAHSTAFSAGTFPCWNTTNNISVDVFIPRFGLLALVNDTTAPRVTVTTPATTQTVSSFVPNITVSSDAARCEYLLNITDSARTSATANLSSAVAPSNSICIWDEVRFKNGAHNITFNVTDAAGNRNLTSSVDERTFTVSDNTVPNTPNGTRISSSVSTTSATVTIGAINESVNATLLYGTVISTLTSIAMQTDFETTQAVSLSSLSAGTLYYFNASVCDFNGNCNTNGTFNFTTSAAASTSTSTTTSDSGGGGGGGAAAVSTVTDSKAQVWQSVPAGSSVSLNVDKSAIAVTSIAVNDVKSDLKSVELEVAALSENPVSTEAASKVYQYFRITKKNIADADAESFKIAFRVTKAWLSENGFASGDVALYRFASSEWNELATKVASTDATYVNYEAETPGFSSFAIGTKSGVKAAEEAPAGEEAGEAPGEEAAPPVPVEAPKAVEAPGKAPIAWIIAAIVVILGIVLIVAYQKQKKKV